jgi:hypothetical protein
MSTPVTVNVTTQKADAVLQLQALLHGIQVKLPGVDPFLLYRLTLSRDELVKRVQTRLDTAIATKTSRQAMHNAVAAERAAQADFKPIRSALRSYLVGVYGANAPELQEFGFVQNRRPAKTVASKASAIAKGKATRVARSTKGRKQKAAVKGAPAASTAPAASAASPAATAPAVNPASTAPVAAPAATAPAATPSPART